MAKAQDYNKLTVAQIKEVFKSRSIPTTKLTKKQQLIDRLVEVDTEESAKAEPAQAQVAGEPNVEVKAVPAPAPEAKEPIAAGANTQEPVEEPSKEGDAPTTEESPSTQEKHDVADAAVVDAPPAQVEGAAQVPDATAAIDTTPFIPPNESVVPTQEQDQAPSPAPTPVAAVESELSQPSTLPVADSDDVAEQAPKLSTPPSEDNRKRKRRSATPPVSSGEAARKRVRQDEEAAVHLNEDTDMKDVHAAQPVGDAADDAAIDAANVVSTAVSANEERLREAESSDQVHDLPAHVSTAISAIEKRLREAESLDRGHDLPGQDEVTEKPRPGGTVQRDAISKHISSGDGAQSSPPPEHEDDTPVEPSIHPATSALYIRNLKRPLRPELLQKHLISVSKGPSSEISPDDADLPTFHLDSIRTHAFAVFPTISAASRARSALHERQWPPEPERERLWVDFVPEDKVAGWIDTETGANAGGRPGMKRWEVIFDKDGDGQVAVSLQEADPHRVSTQNGLAGHRPSVPPTPLSAGPPDASFAPKPEVRHERDMEVDAPSKEVPSQSFLALDSLFESTTAKPKLYYKPVAKELADKRLDELDRRSLPDMRGSLSSGGSGLPDSRRYTFEDGDLLVDAGPEFGLRGPAFGGRGRGRGRGRGGWR